MTKTGKIAAAASHHGAAPWLTGLTGWDVGARGGVVENWRDAQPLLHVVGFDADADADSGSNPNITWCPVGLDEHSGSRELHLLRRRSGSSLLAPNLALLSQFNTDEYCGFDGTVTIECLSAADAIESRNLPTPDIVKLDTQGTEVPILKGFTDAQRAAVLAVELEVEFLELYEGQPLFSDVDRYMTAEGFTLFDIRTHRAFRSDGKERAAYLRKLSRTWGSARMNAQLIAGDAVYFRLPSEGDAPSREHVARLVVLLCMYRFFESALWVAETYADTDDVRRALGNTVRDAAGRPTLKERFGGRRYIRGSVSRLGLPFLDRRVFYTRRAWPNQ